MFSIVALARVVLETGNTLLHYFFYASNHSITNRHQKLLTLLTYPHAEAAATYQLLFFQQLLEYA